MALTQVEPYMANSAGFSFANVTITNAIIANNSAGVSGIGTNGQVLISTGTKTVWENSLSPFLLMGA